MTRQTNSKIFSLSLFFWGVWRWKNLIDGIVRFIAEEGENRNAFNGEEDGGEGEGEMMSHRNLLSEFFE